MIGSRPTFAEAKCPLAIKVSDKINTLALQSPNCCKHLDTKTSRRAQHAGCWHVYFDYMELGSSNLCAAFIHHENRRCHFSNN